MNGDAKPRIALLSSWENFINPTIGAVRMSEEMQYEYLVPLEKYLSAGVRLGTRLS